jgi:cytochrome P450
MTRSSPVGQSRPDGAVLGEAAAGFDLFNLPAGYIEDPWPWFRALRDHDPVHRNSDGTVLLTRYDDVRAVWRDPTASVDKSEMFLRRFGEGPLYEHHTTGMLFRDPPDHDRLRALVSPIFSAAAMQRMSGLVADLVDTLLDRARQAGEFDVVADFAARIPIQVITRLVGLPPADGELLRSLGQRVLFPLNPDVTAERIRSGHAAVAEFTAYLAGHLRRVRTQGVHGEPANVLEALVASEAASGKVSEAEIVHTCLLMLNGGHETTTNLISLGTLALMEHPAAAAELAGRHDELARTGVEEITRYVTPLQLQGRRTTRPVELPSGQTLPAGTEVVLCQASANRDERRFAGPDGLDLRRKPNPHVSFGLGVHTCIGRPLARLETLVAFPRIAQLAQRLEMTDRPVFASNVRFRGLVSMPVRVN